MVKKCVKGNDYNQDIYRSDADHWQDGEYTVYRTTHWSAPGCHDGCGILIYVKDGKLDHVEGDPNNGWSRGTLCMRCLDLFEAVNSPARIKYPMVRDPKDRGNADAWKRISWDEAFALIKEKVEYYQENFGNASIVTTVGTGRNATYQPSVLEYLGFKSPSMIGGFLSGDSCYSPRGSVMALMAGCFTLADMSQTLEQRYDAPEYKIPECIVIWGNNPLQSNGDGFLGHWIVENMKCGSDLVVIDPRLTWLAAKARIHLQLRPGTDGALAMAIAGIIDNEGMTDQDFVDNWSYGFNEFIAACKKMTPERAAEICDLPVDDIYAAARFMGSAKPMAIQWGLKIDQNVSSTPLGQTIIGIQGMTGNIDVPGGNILMPGHAFGLTFSQCDALRFIPEEDRHKCLGIKTFPMRHTGNDAMGHTDVMLETIESDGALADTDPKFMIKMFMFHSNNIIACMGAEAPRVYEAILKVEFNVTMDTVWTPTIQGCCDLVLPVAMSPERDSIRAWWWPLRAIKKVTDRYYECKTDEELIAELINYLNPDAPVPPTGREWLQQSLDQSTAHIKLEDLEREVIMWPEWHYKKYETGEVRYDGQPGFNTPTGLFEFTPVFLTNNGLADVPFYDEPPESPVSTPELYEKYPIILMTGRRSWEFFHSEHRDLPTMREFHPDPLCELSPETAESLGFAEGDWVWLENQRGRCRHRVRLTPGGKFNYVMAEHAWWFPEGDPNDLYGVFNSNINNLTSQCQVGRSGYGAPYNGLLCKIYKCTEENSQVLPNEQVLKRGGFKYERAHIFK